MRVSLCVSIALCFVLLPGVALARNQPPIADAGGDRTVSTDHTITLKGSATDPDGDPIVTWQWSLDSQPPRSDASLFPTWSAKPVFVADTVGEYIVSLTVFDGTDWGRPDTATITVVDNQPPVADAGGDQSTFTLEIIVLLGSATDPDGDEIVEWQWSVDSQPAGSYAVISPDWTATPTFFADTVGEYIVSLIVFDGTDWSEPDTVTITVVDNQPPVAVATADVVSGPAPLTVHFDGSGSYDPEGGPLSYDWYFGDGVGGSPELSPTYVYKNPGTYEAELLVRDERDQGGIDSVTITVTSPENQPPVADAGGDRSIIKNETATLVGSATDPDGDEIVEWQWSLDSQPPGSFVDLSPTWSSATTFSADMAGDYIVSLIVFDGTDWSLPDTITITVADNQPPVAVVTADVVTGPVPLTVHFDGSG
ncbi:MAG: PKD domain-containing protein, partial [Phycisphaerales bacterium]